MQCFVDSGPRVLSSFQQNYPAHTHSESDSYRLSNRSKSAEGYNGLAFDPLNSPTNHVESILLGMICSNLLYISALLL